MVAQASGAAIAEPELLPASFAQQQLWFLDQLVPGNPFYNMSAAARLSGPLNVSALRWAVSRIADRHEVLRTTFKPVNGVLHQVVGEALPVVVDEVDLSQVTGAGVRAAELTGAMARAPFDLERGPLLRVSVLRLGERENMLLITMHHIVSDGWSVGVLVAELNAFYSAFCGGWRAELPPLLVQYGDFAIWQRSRLEGTELDAQRDYWRRTLADMPAALELPYDYPRPSVRRYGGASHHFQLSPALSSQIAKLARRERTTVFMTLLAAFQLLLSCYTAAEDVAVGSLVAGRVREELEPLIGFFANTVVLRTDLSGDPTFRELLRRVREVAFGAYSNQDMPFEQLVEDLSPAREPGRNPLVQVLVVIRHIARAPMSLPGLTVEGLGDPSSVSRFDLTLYVEDGPELLGGTFEYSTELFRQATVSRLAIHFEHLLEDVMTDPDKAVSQVSILGAEEYHQIVKEWNS
jgi:Condensation domain